MSRGDICTPTFTVELLTLVEKEKQLKCPSRDEWINKMWYVQKWKIIQSLSKEILTQATNGGPLRTLCQVK